MWSYEKKAIVKELNEKYTRQDWLDAGIPYAIDYSYKRFTGEIIWFINLDLVQDFIYDDFDYEQKPNIITGKSISTSGETLAEAALSGDPVAYVQKISEVNEQGLPKPTGVNLSENGYITPNGLYYPCGTMEHIWLASVIEEELNFPEEKLVKCAQSQINPKWKEIYAAENYEPTSKQKKTAVDYALKYNTDFPVWLKPGE